MGSRSRRNAALAALVLGGCAVGAPTGFSSGDQWTVPLVGPLENGVLLVPVYIGKENAGPYLFAIDPDATVSAVDDKIVSEAHLRSGQGPRLERPDDRQISESSLTVLDEAARYLCSFRIFGSIFGRKPVSSPIAGRYAQRW